jgi:hypothetical protein
VGGIIQESRAALSRYPRAASSESADLTEREAGDLDWRVNEDQFLEFDFKFVKIPLAFFAQPIKGKAQRPLFHIRQVINPDAGHGRKTQDLCRLDPDFPIKDKIVLADKDRSTEPQFADRAHEFPHMSRSALADFTRRQLQIVKSDAYEFELGAVGRSASRAAPQTPSRAAGVLCADGRFSVATDAEKTAR